MSEEQVEDNTGLDRDYDLFTMDMPDDLDPRIHLAMIAYNTVKMAIGEWKAAFKKQLKDSKTDSAAKCQFNITTAQMIVGMCKEAQEGFKMSDNWESLKNQIKEFREQVDMLENIQPINKAKIFKQLDDVERKVDKQIG
jgi:hypothetical protein